MMFDKLKSLPLTILLTLLVWMYAEAQFTSTQPEVPISVRIASGSPDYALRTMNPVDKRYSSIMSFVVTLQGPKSQLDQIFQESQGMRDNLGDDKLAALTYIPANEQLQAAARDGRKLKPNVIQMLNGLEYFRSHGVTVTSAAPLGIEIEVDLVSRVHKTAVFQSGMAVETVTLDPSNVEVQVPQDSLRSIGESKIVVHAVPANEAQLAAIPPDTEKVIPVRYVVDYPGPRDERIRVIPAQGNARVRIRRTLQSSVTVNDVPIWVSGPPGVLGRFDVDIVPKSVSITLSGPSALVEGLRQRLSTGPQGAGVYAYLDLTADDKSDPMVLMRRTLRYVYPEGLTLLRSQPDAGFRLTEKVPATVPAASQVNAIK